MHVHHRHWDSGGGVARALASHHGDLGSMPGGLTPGFPHVGIVLDDAAFRWVFSGYSRFPALAFLRHSILGSHFMVCLGMTGTYGSQLKSPLLGRAAESVWLTTIYLVFHWLLTVVSCTSGLCDSGICPKHAMLFPSPPGGHPPHDACQNRSSNLWHSHKIMWQGEVHLELHVPLQLHVQTWQTDAVYLKRARARRDGKTVRPLRHTSRAGGKGIGEVQLHRGESSTYLGFLLQGRIEEVRGNPSNCFGPTPGVGVFPEHACEDFRCNSEFCIDTDLVCDEVNHCGDNSDEAGSVICACECNTCKCLLRIGRETWVALNIEVLRVGDGREHPPTSGIIQHDSIYENPGATPPEWSPVRMVMTVRRYCKYVSSIENLLLGSLGSRFTSCEQQVGCKLKCQLLVRVLSSPLHLASYAHIMCSRLAQKFVRVKCVRSQQTQKVQARIGLVKASPLTTCDQLILAH
ncbi:hypothetical protein PR048_016564 [Dryococelus australis]|uniref:Uncharacterized protein n=1 Tax=Dryococelus australis TaxID=614101 RepID=A0ABQ9HKQ7_9NEOP|nr:hypothetical protein PR048_016564 [Dryococelus australis]